MWGKTYYKKRGKITTGNMILHKTSIKTKQYCTIVFVKFEHI